MVKVYLIGEVRFYRDALEEALQRSGRVEVLGSASHAFEAVEALPLLLADVAVFDMRGPGAPAWAKELGTVVPAVRLLVLGLQEAEREIAMWAKAGVVGYLGCDASLNELIAAVESAAVADHTHATGTEAMHLRHGPHRRPAGVSGPGEGRRVTGRQREILHLIGRGLSNGEIAARLFISVSTVKNHVHNILETLGVSCRADAVKEIRRTGFLSCGTNASSASPGPRSGFVRSIERRSA
jgi:DNA-binding NarL/FixJ family response regulator